MGIIQVLADDLANQIAAGEVVERPASVVKELVENALDAGPTRIQVDIERGGVDLIRVTDDGCGMDADDARLALTRHATSKIRAFADLTELHTFGFRGEALPSIASVSKFSLRTRRAEDSEGVEALVEGGSPAKTRPAGCAQGTSVEAKDLFFNVPARRKFLKATATESAHVGEVVLLAALSQPDVTFVLTRDGKTAKEYLRASGRAERVRGALPEDKLESFLVDHTSLRIEAFLAAPERSRSGAGSLHLLVNGRPVKDRALARAVAQAYGSVLEGGRYPVGVVYLEIAPDLVDVNVHPQKAEVRFVDSRSVLETIARQLNIQLAKAFGLPAGPLFRPPPAARSSVGFGTSAPKAEQGAWSFQRPPSASASPTSAFPAFTSPASASHTSALATSAWPTGVPSSAPRAAAQATTNSRPGQALDARDVREAQTAHLAHPAQHARDAWDLEGPTAMAPSLPLSDAPRPASGRPLTEDPGARSEGPMAAVRVGASDRSLAASQNVFESPVPATTSPSAPAAASAVFDGPWASPEAEDLAAPVPATTATPMPASVAPTSAVQYVQTTSPSAYAHLRYLGQAKQTFLICEGPDGLVILDQHAAAERVTFHRLKQSYASSAVAMQHLLLPEVIALTPKEVEALEEEAEAIARLGVELRAVGTASVAVHAVPALLLKASPERIVRELLAEVGRTARRPFSEMADHILATMACHGSVRAGDPLTEVEARALLHALDEVDFANHCPHGRPVVTRLSFRDLELKVGRP